jgi:outer membrane protein OmpA-like peptidoglycan-associated protein
MDKEDTCPLDSGLVEFKGCPDKDGDKTPDKDDLCPDNAGPIDLKGCPDKDGDTVLDKDDACPEVAGVIENKGCPWPDSDGDGVNDKEDECPSVQGEKELKGCPPAPVLKAAEQKILEKAFSSLEFATGKDVIKPASFKSLNELAGLMKQHKDDWKLTLSGHTDNQGDAVKNMELSEKRSKAVKKYLVSKGASEEAITVEWFGSEKPIESNDTETGRQKNRRVEMKVSYKQ